MQRIQRASKAVKLLAHALFWVSAIAGAVTIYTVTRLANDTLQIITGYGIVAAVLMMALTRHVARLAELYENGKLFTADNVRHLKWIGRLTLLTSVGPGMKPDGDDIGLSVEVYPAVILVSLLLMFISWVMDEARKLDEEHQLVI